MERWVGKVAVVTGAGSGIGAAVATSLVENGVIVVGLDIEEKRLEELAKKLNTKGKFHQVRADLRKEKDILDAFSWIDKNLGGIHIFVNNAGVLTYLTPFTECETDQMAKLLDINVLALSICSKEAIKSMKKYNIDDGNIINIASIFAHVSSPTPGYVMYTATKKAVYAITEGLRVELALAKSKIKVTSICPGLISTNMLPSVGQSILADTPYIMPENVADTIIFSLQMPPEVQITDLHVRALGEDLTKLENICAAVTSK